jgi:hypothetical protein
LVVGVGVRARRRSWSWGWSSTWPRDRSLRRIIIVEGVQLASLNCTNEYVDEQDSPERERLLQEVLSTKLHDEKIMEEVRISGVEKPGRGSGVDEREQLLKFHESISRYQPLNRRLQERPQYGNKVLVIPVHDFTN